MLNSLILHTNAAAVKKEVANIHSNLQQNKKKDTIIDASSPISNGSANIRSLQCQALHLAAAAERPKRPRLFTMSPSIASPI